MGAQEDTNGNVAARNKSAMRDEITLSLVPLNWS